MVTSRLLAAAGALALALLCSVSAPVWAQFNTPPNASAGPDQLVLPGAFVTLNGSLSGDSDFDSITLLWEQVLGDPVTLSDTSYSCTFGGPNSGICTPGLPNPTFTAPVTNQLLRFKLTVIDVPQNTGGPDTSFDFVDITVSSVPLPAAVWLFGSGLLGLIGVARSRTPSL